MEVVVRLHQPEGSVQLLTSQQEATVEGTSKEVALEEAVVATAVASNKVSDARAFSR